MKQYSLLVALLMFCSSAMAWKGIDMDAGTIIDIQLQGAQKPTQGNVMYLDHADEELKLGYLNMFDAELGVILDLESGELIRVKMANQPPVQQ